MAVTPMFPLGTTVLPGAAVPLRVFEQRYVQLVHDLLAADEPPAFGTVLIERGQEVGGDDERADVGTLVRIGDLSATPEGGYLIAGIGVERIRVVRWVDDDPYPRAETTPWPDETSEPGDADVHRLLGEVITKTVDLASQIRRLGHDIDAIADGLADEPSVAVYQLATRAPLGPADRYRVLAAPSVEERCRVLSSAIDDAMAVIEFHRS